MTIMSVAAAAQAKVDLVTLPARDTVQLTIYNSADMTLVRDGRALTLKQGENALQFSWENTLIDPTSLEMLPKGRLDAIEVAELTYPARAKNVGVWNVRSQTSGKVPIEISYLTSGLAWRAFYMGTLSSDEKTMHLEGFVRVTNSSGEDYENAQVRLIVGKVHILDEIAELAQREYPYGRPEGVRPPSPTQSLFFKTEMERFDIAEAAAPMMMDAAIAPKEIAKEGLSEYFLYTIEGTETIPNGWSKRLLSLDVDDVPVTNLYKFEEDRYGESVTRFLSFKNDKDHKLGATPIPDGTMRVYRKADAQGHLSYEGESSFMYIPVNEDVELDLGPVENVVVEPTLMEYRTDNYRFDRDRDVAGWDEIQVFEVKVKNTRDVPVKVEIRRNFETPYWTLKRTGQIDEFEKVDVDTVEFNVLLPPRSERAFQYTLTTYQGTRTEDWDRLSR
jgi:hypothetical protein